MAIAGSYNIPSRTFYARNGKLHQLGTVVNRPESALVTLDNAVDMIEAGGTACFDVRGSNVTYVAEQLIERGVISRNGVF